MGKGLFGAGAAQSLSAGSGRPQPQARVVVAISHLKGFAHEIVRVDFGNANRQSVLRMITRRAALPSRVSDDVVFPCDLIDSQHSIGRNAKAACANEKLLANRSDVAIKAACSPLSKGRVFGGEGEAVEHLLAN